jgi:hypothetical protein
MAALQTTSFVQHVRQSSKKRTFCKVNAHFQNGIAEQVIRDLLGGAKMQFLHTCQRWPQAVSTALWLYALCHTAYLDNVLPTLEGEQSKLKLFSSIQVGSNMHFMHTFGCPVFALNNSLA